MSWRTDLRKYVPDNFDLANTRKEPKVSPPWARTAPPSLRFLTGISETQKTETPVEKAGDIPTEWLNGVARLQTMPCPSAYDPVAWSRAVNDAQGFVRSPWASQAARLAWGVADLFGVNPDAPCWRLDGMGLIPLLQGREIRAITNISAAIKCWDDATLTFSRETMAASGAAMWHLK